MKQSQSAFRKLQSEIGAGYQHGRIFISRHHVLLYTSARTLLVAIITLLIIVIVGIYGFAWQNSFSHMVSKAVPLPASTVDSSYIRYSIYLDQIDYLKRLIAYEAESLEVEAEHSDQEINRQAIESLINAEIVRLHARDLGVSVSDDEITDNLNQLYVGQEDLKQSLEEQGITEDMLKRQVEVQLLQFKLSQQLASDEALDEEQSIVDWIGNKREQAQVRYLLPQHAD